ncbi:uncharacterized protein [Epargyreus clarus]|uniref:uncharacterized protein n=1 Tax=Epargyreus clarus TaxID=520877 RepID=UPI003C2AFA0C
MDPQELVPLEAGQATRVRPARHFSHVASRTCYQGPIRLCRLLILMIFLPSLFIFIPLYMRYRVFSGQMYPMSMTDMRLIDSKISPLWCQRQVVKSNTTFNAFVVPGPPELEQELVPVSMTRQLELQDDMKEYWGFYLLKGSTVTVSACVSWPGASLIMIKGYKHLQECAYIGDDSSEELDELKEAYKLGLLSKTTFLEKEQELKKDDGKANRPETMKRHKAGVSFHDPNQKTNLTASDSVPAVDVTDHDPKELREILERLHAIRQAAKLEALKNYRVPSHLMQVPELHRYRDTNVDRDERRWLSFKDLDGNNSSQVFDRTTRRFRPNMFPRKELSKATVTMSKDGGDKEDKPIDDKVDKETKVENYRVAHVKFDGNETENKPKGPKPEEPSSKEVFEEVLKQLQALGDRGKAVLVKLHESMGMEHTDQPSNKTKHELIGSEEDLDRLRKILVEAIDEEKTRPQRQQKRRDAREEARNRREVMLGSIDLEKELNEDDVARDYAAEEGLEPDGYADHHVKVNETNEFDMSNSEYWSSFSSSEEALLECEGLILNLPLIPHSSCVRNATDDDTRKAARANALTYRVPANGYYFFVFNSENEVQTNFIKARFDLQKTRYDVAKTTLRECKNSTERCDLLLDMFSSQKVVLEVPLRNNDSLWNEQFVIISECEPRTSIYLACVISVPILILVFAFQ